MMIREYKPEGFSSWTAYYQHKAKVAKIKQFVEYVLCIIIIGLCVIVDSIISLILRSLQ